MCPHPQCPRLVAAAPEHPEHAAVGFLLEGPGAPLAVQVPSWDMQAFVLGTHTKKIRICKVWKCVFIGSPAKSIFMSVLFMSASLQSSYFFPSQLLLSYGNPPLPPIYFHPCQVPGAGAGFSQRSGPLAGRSKCPLMTWGV